MLILINNSSLLYTENAKIEQNPLFIFEQYYIQKNVDLTQTFPAWLTTFLLPINNEGYTDDQIKQTIENILQNPKLLRRATFRLYPAQYEFKEDNWVFIKQEIETALTNKKTRPIQLTTFDELKAYVSTQIDTILSF